MKKLVFVALLFSLSCCSGGGSSSYTDFRSYDEIADLRIGYQEVFSVTHDSHYVFYYSDTCYNCKVIKDDIVAFAKDNKHLIYFVLVEGDIPHNYGSNEINLTLNKTNVEDVYVGATPQMALISNDRIEKNIIGNEYLKREISQYY